MPDEPSDDSEASFLKEMRTLLEDGEHGEADNPQPLDVAGVDHGIVPMAQKDDESAAPPGASGTMLSPGVTPGDDEGDPVGEAAFGKTEMVTGTSALADIPEIGDPGRQREVVPVPGPLTLGVPDTELDFWSVGPFELRACSTRGMSHRYSGAPRQDSFCVGSDGQWVVFAIADGVSQGHYSQVAAETAARAACKLLLEAATSSADGCGLDELDWSLMCDRISRRILDEAKYRKLVQVPDEATPGEQVKIVRQAMSTTAVVGAVSRSVADQGGHTAWIAALAGDSGAYKLADGRISAVVGGKPEDESGISESAVRALPGASNPAVVKCHIAVGEAVLLTSDGLGDPIGSGDGEIGAALANRWAQPPTATQFFEETNFLRRTFDDDRTAVGVWVVDRPAVDGADGFGGSEPG